MCLILGFVEAFIDPTVIVCFYAQAAVLLHVSHFGFPGNIHQPNRDLTVGSKPVPNRLLETITFSALLSYTFGDGHLAGIFGHP